MKRQILLLFGLILIGTLGLAAGIEASKGNWDYRSLIRSRAPWQSAEGTVQTPLTAKTVLSSAVPQCAQNGAAPNAFVRFVLKRAEGQQDVMSDQAPCVTATEGERTKGRKVSFCSDCPRKEATEVGLESLVDPQSAPSSESLPGDTEAVRFLG
ncbi:MAG TPA: hypothetical protein VGX03_02445 [Candidatus Binatia bacterium]|jgi:hypothetical protein|nr:hypothetical protein [Candidatus Binatia bacterium]